MPPSCAGATINNCFRGSQRRTRGSRFQTTSVKDGQIQSTFPSSPSLAPRVDEAWVLRQNRWLLVELLPVPAPLPGRAPTGQPQEELTSKQIWAALKQSIITHFGDTGWGAVGSSLTSTSRTAILPAVTDHCTHPAHQLSTSRRGRTCASYASRGSRTRSRGPAWPL